MRLAGLGLDDIGAQVTALRRGGQGIALASDAVLLDGDVLVLRGDGEALNRAEERLL